MLNKKNFPKAMFITCAELTDQFAMQQRNNKLFRMLIDNRPTKEMIAFAGVTRTRIDQIFHKLCRLLMVRFRVEFNSIPEHSTSIFAIRQYRQPWLRILTLWEKKCEQDYHNNLAKAAVRELI